MTVVLHVQDTAAFFEHFENLCFDNSVGIMLRKMDKKKEKYSLNTSTHSLTHSLTVLSTICSPLFRQLMQHHYQSLVDSLSEEQDPAMVLHLVTVLLFQQRTGSMIHITGRLVPHITSLLSKYLPPDEYLRLIHYQDLVVTRLKLASKPSVEQEPLAVEEEDSLVKVTDELTALLGNIKSLVIKPKQ